ncbi:fused MFS/spermidine synthase [Candidatus Poribacteria bacterium]|nr:fused MFS/spermidine synthase [Candidatus Poribacteria bacterium]
MKKTILLSSFLIGIVSLVGQIMLIREFMQVFYGNELSFGVVLFAWMFWVAIGSWGLGALTQKSTNNHIYLVLCQLFIIVLLPLEIFLIRIIKYLIHVPPTEIIQISSMLYSAFLITLPFCIIIGFMFTLQSRLIGEENNDGIDIGMVYLFESLGAITGGIIYNFILIDKLDIFSISYIIGSLALVISGLSLFYFKNKISNISKIFLVILSLVIGILLCYSIFIPQNKSLSQISLDILWKDYNLIESKNSKYGNIAVVKNKNEITFFENGLYLFTAPDELFSEEVAHLSLLPHPLPKRVLLIGGGFGGVLKEMLKHPVEKIVYAEIDPLIIELSKKYLPLDAAFIFSDKIKILNIDGRRYLKGTQEKFDVVIVNLIDPLTAQLNRFFTLEFFREVKSVLQPGGIFSLKTSGTENYISIEQSQYLASIKNTLSIIFPHVKIIPARSGNYMLSGSEEISIDLDLLMDNLRKRNIDAKYVQEYYLAKANMSKERMEYFNKTLEKTQDTKINKDFDPSCYYFNLIYWNSLFNPGFNVIFKKILLFKLWWVLVFALLIFVCVFFISRENSTLQKKSVITAVMANGFSEILFEIVIILAFQSLYGFVYYKVGVVIASYMLGLSIGAYLALRGLRKGIGAYKELIRIEYFTFLYPLCLMAIFSILKKIILSDIIIDMLFIFLAICAGVLGGYQFPFATACYQNKNTEAGDAAGALYSMDLIGACLGTLMTNLFLIPIMGVYSTCIVSMFISLCVIVFLKLA